MVRQSPSPFLSYLYVVICDKQCSGSGKICEKHQQPSLTVMPSLLSIISSCRDNIALSSLKSRREKGRGREVGEGGGKMLYHSPLPWEPLVRCSWGFHKTCLSFPRRTVLPVFAHTQTACAHMVRECAHTHTHTHTHTNTRSQKCT